MSKEDSTQKTTLPKLVKLDKAFKLAEQWVNNMTKSTDESAEVELEGRPARLGLGSTVPRQSRIGSSNDPVERKLLAKLNIGRRNASKNTVESTPSAGDGCGDNDDDDDEDLDSRTNAFAKKRAVPWTPSLQPKKKKKKKKKK